MIQWSPKVLIFLFELTEVYTLLDCLADFGRLLTGRAVRKDFLKEKSLAESKVFWWVCDCSVFATYGTSPLYGTVWFCSCKFGIMQEETCLEVFCHNKNGRIGCNMHELYLDLFHFGLLRALLSRSTKLRTSHQFSDFQEVLPKWCPGAKLSKF